MRLFEVGEEVEIHRFWVENGSFHPTGKIVEDQGSILLVKIYDKQTFAPRVVTFLPCDVKKMCVKPLEEWE